jgi:hypothetical protein
MIRAPSKTLLRRQPRGWAWAAWSPRSLGEFISHTVIPVSVVGTFAWSRLASDTVVWRVYFTAEGGRSNMVTIR